MRRTRFIAYFLAAILLIVLLPVGVATFQSPTKRVLQGVNLADIRYQEIGFRNEQQGIELAGLLFVPEGTGPHPAAVIIHGSGTSQRDNRWYLTLVDHLVDQGIAVLLPDKRGSEQSEGDWRTASFDDLASDTVAAVAYLESQNAVPLSKIGVIGMSQGGAISPLVASQSPELKFVVNVVGGIGPMRDQLMYEENHNLRQMGCVPGLSNVIARLSTSYLMHVGQKTFWDAVGNFDNIPYWQQLNIPALVLYGQDDTNVDSIGNAASLNSLGNDNIAVTIYQGSGHALEDPPELGNSIFRRDALEQIVQFIQSVTTD